jgi:tetratricopeptide (TPR) repeat protein
MHIVQTEIPKPTSEGEFEEMCARIYGEVFGDSLPNINGRRGQEQAGIDVFVKTTDGRIGIQCKRYADGRLKISHINQEVERANNAGTPIVRLIVATTATSDSTLLREVQDLSDARAAAGLFTVDIQFWQDICRHIRSNGRLQSDYAPNDPGGGIYRIEKIASATFASVDRIESTLELQSGLPVARADSLNKLISKQLDEVNEMLKKCRFSDAQEGLQHIGSDLSAFDAHQKARWYLQRGICIWHLESGAAAASDFIKASELYPDDEKMAAAKIRGLLLKDEIDVALSVGQQALDRFPESVHVWVAYANASFIKGNIVKPEDAPHSMRTNPDVLQLLAWGAKGAGQLVEALQLINQALDAPSAGYFTRAAALAIALEAATTDGIKASFGLIDEFELMSLRRAIDEFEPRLERLWPIQSTQSMSDTLVQLGYSYIVLDRFEDALLLTSEAKHRGVSSPRLLRVELDALKHLDRTDEFLTTARRSLFELGEEALLLVAETAAEVGDVSLVDEVKDAARKISLTHPGAQDALRALRWVALWRSAIGRHQALEDVRAAELNHRGSLTLLCAGGRILYAAKAEDEAESVIRRAKAMVTSASSASDRLMLAEFLSATDHFSDAIPLYESFVSYGRHSELHNRLLACYVRTGARRKARELLTSFPANWSSDDGARSLAMELGQRAGDWTFLEPLTHEQCQREPNRVGSWLFRLLVDLKLKKLARFYDSIMQLPPVLEGSIRQTAQLASLEMRYGKPQEGLARLYRCLRENQDDIEAASAYLIAVVSAPESLPNMEETLPEVVAGSSVRLVDEFGGTLTVTIDPSTVGALPVHGEFHPAADPEIAPLLGAAVGTSVAIPQAFESVRRYKIHAVTSAYRRAVQYANEKISSSLKTPHYIVSVPVPETEEGTDFSHMHAMLKKQSEHSRLAFETYSSSPITLGILAKMLGKSTVELVSAWPTEGPALFTCIGTSEEREEALRLLTREAASYVIDAATLAELVSLNSVNVLSILPRVYASRATQELLESLLEEACESKAEGYVQDVDGVMRYLDITESDRARDIKFFEALIDALQCYCEVLPAYGPECLVAGLEKAESILEREEYGALLLAAEKDATLFTLDGRLAILARQFHKTGSVWPQTLLMHAVNKGAMERATYSYACVQLFLSHRSFVSLRAQDLVVMCLQGGAFLQYGLQRFKEYLANPSTEYESGSRVALEFLELQAHQFTHVKALCELASHIVEACVRHPACDRDVFFSMVNKLFQKFIEELIGPEHLYPPANIYRATKRRILFELFGNSLREAVTHAAVSTRGRALRLKVLFCTERPLMMYDGSIASPLLGNSAPESQTEIDYAQ